MNPEKSKNYQQETYIIPNDIMLEIAQIIVQADLPHEIIGVKENKRQIVISVSSQANLKFHQEALKNIDNILNDYHTMCSDESDAVNWRES